MILLEWILSIILLGFFPIAAESYEVCTFSRTMENDQPCVFPFRYQGVTYNTCTTAGHDRLWCATSISSDQSLLTWGTCITNRIDDGSSSGGTCVFPFYYNDVPYTSCTYAGGISRPWCATAADQDPIIQWGYCEPECYPIEGQGNSDCFVSDRTEGGNAGGDPCHFPFEANGVSYNSCTDVFLGQKWCSTVADHSAPDATWGYCIYDCNVGEEDSQVTNNPTSPEECTINTESTQGGNGNGAPCVFPFAYGGQVYETCTERNHDTLWCSTVQNFETDGGKWGECIMDCSGDVDEETPIPCEPDTDCNTTTTTTTPDILPTKQDELPPCTIRTHGGNGDNEYCSFPFSTSDGQIFNDCAPSSLENKGAPWCATTSNYPEDQVWGFCEVKSSFGVICEFPFTYQGVTYTDCTRDGGASQKLWCATVSDLSIDSSYWGYCIPRDPSCYEEKTTTELTTETFTQNSDVTEDSNNGKNITLVEGVDGTSPSEASRLYHISRIILLEITIANSLYIYF